MSRRRTPILALVGGIGCGKSALAAWLAGHARACVVDADAVGHAVLRRADVRDRLVDAFGTDVLRDGQIDRSVIARRVFGDTATHQAARQTLESIVHPVMRNDFEQAFRAACSSSDFDLIVFDAAVLLESGWQDAVDAIAFVEVPLAERVRRVARRGWSEQQLRQREASQWPLERKRAAAHVVIDNSGALDAAGRQLEAWLQEQGWLPAGHAAAPQLTN
jgi:dephospho-CoA kinase